MARAKTKRGAGEIPGSLEEARGAAGANPAEEGGQAGKRRRFMCRENCIYMGRFTPAGTVVESEAGSIPHFEAVV
jgi:hypothetical protein